MTIALCLLKHFSFCSIIVACFVSTTKSPRVGKSAFRRSKGASKKNISPRQWYDGGTQSSATFNFALMYSVCSDINKRCKVQCTGAHDRSLCKATQANTRGCRCLCTSSVSKDLSFLARFKMSTMLALLWKEYPGDLSGRRRTTRRLAPKA